MNETIHTVTLACADVARAARAYTEHLGYRRCYEGKVAARQAELWQCPRLCGAEQVLLRPGNGGEHYLRLVRQPAAADYRAFASYGWNALEILVSDVDGLAAELAASPFRMQGEPADLSFTDKIRAMQVLGPAREILYLTEIKGAVDGFDLPVARRPVEHCFVTILGTADIRRARRFYQRCFALGEAPIIASRVVVMSAAFGLEREHRHDIAALDLGGGYLLEIDAMPPAAAPRRVADGFLPPGIAMVTFATRDFDACAAAAGLAAQRLKTPPYRGRRVAFFRGGDGEGIELLERAA